MKKRFFQSHICFWLINLLLYGTAIGASIYLLCGGICNSNWICIVLGSICLLMIVTHTIRSSYYHITFTDDYVYISGELISRDIRTQFKDVIEYKDISDIKIVIDNKNSKNKPFSWHDTSRNTPRTYFEFALNNGKRKRMYIMFFSKRQRIKMLDIINEKCNLNKDYMTMYNEHK